MDNASLMKELEILKTENETLKSKLAFTKSHLFDFVDTYIKYNEIGCLHKITEAFEEMTSQNIDLLKNIWKVIRE